MAADCTTSGRAVSLTVVAVDLSLAATGVAVYRPERGESWAAVRTYTITTDPRDGLHRRAWTISKHLWAYSATVGPNTSPILYAFEAEIVPSPHARERGMGRIAQAMKIAKVRAIVEHGLWRNDREWINVHPSKIKKFATGAGNASKEDVYQAAAAMFGSVIPINDSYDEADALWLLAMVLTQYTKIQLLPTLSPVPLSKRMEALKDIDWPVLPSLSSGSKQHAQRDEEAK